MKRTLFVVLLLVGLFVLCLALMRSLSNVLPFTLGVDLVPRWVGTEAMLEGISPYSIEARQRTWRVIYGTDEPQGNVFGFYYPPAITTLLLPFVLAHVSVASATVVWSAFILSVWVAGLLIFTRRKPLLILAIFLLSGVFFRPAFSNYILGQTALLGVLALGAGYELARRQRWLLSGVLLALSLLKPSFMLLPVFLMLILHRQWKLWFSFLFVVFVLNIPSFFLVGWWVPDFLKEISAYATENVAAWSPADDLLSLTGISWMALSAALMARGFRQKDDALLLASALAFNAAFAPHTADYDLVAFLGLLLWLEAQVSTSLFLVLFWFPWITLLLVPGIEPWYRLIWLTYPVLLLATASLSVWKLSHHGLSQQKNTIL